MKPDFALSLSTEAVALLHREGRSWRELGNVSLSDPALRDRLAGLRAEAEALAADAVTAKVVVPPTQVLYTAIPCHARDEGGRVAAIRTALAGMTPYPLEELAFDWEAEGDVLHVAVVARETLDQAEAFAVEHGFNPVSFVTLSHGGSFTGEPFFGETISAAAILPRGQRVKRDVTPTVPTHRAAGTGPSSPPASVPAAPETGPVPVAAAPETAPEPPFRLTGAQDAPAAGGTDPADAATEIGLQAVMAENCPAVAETDAAADGEPAIGATAGEAPEFAASGASQPDLAEQPDALSAPEPDGATDAFDAEATDAQTVPDAPDFALHRSDMPEPVADAPEVGPADVAPSDETSLDDLLGDVEPSEAALWHGESAPDDPTEETPPDAPAPEIGSEDRATGAAVLSEDRPTESPTQSSEVATQVDVAEQLPQVSTAVDDDAATPDTANVIDDFDPAPADAAEARVQVPEDIPPPDIADLGDDGSEETAGPIETQSPKDAAVDAEGTDAEARSDDSREDPAASDDAPPDLPGFAPPPPLTRPALPDLGESDDEVDLTDLLAERDGPPDADGAGRERPAMFLRHPFRPSFRSRLNGALGAAATRRAADGAAETPIDAAGPEVERPAPTVDQPLPQAAGVAETDAEPDLDPIPDPVDEVAMDPPTSVLSATAPEIPAAQERPVLTAGEPVAPRRGLKPLPPKLAAAAAGLAAARAAGAVTRPPFAPRIGAAVERIGVTSGELPPLGAPRPNGPVRSLSPDGPALRPGKPPPEALLEVLKRQRPVPRPSDPDGPGAAAAATSGAVSTDGGRSPVLDTQTRRRSPLTGLVLTAGLIAVLAAVGLSSALFGPETEPGATAALDPAPGPVELAPEEAPAAEAILGTRAEEPPPARPDDIETALVAEPAPGEAPTEDVAAVAPEDGTEPPAMALTAPETEPDEPAAAPSETAEEPAGTATPAPDTAPGTAPDTAPDATPVEATGPGNAETSDPAEADPAADAPTEDDLAVSYAATGIWSRAPEAPEAAGDTRLAEPAETPVDPAVPEPAPVAAPEAEAALYEAPPALPMPPPPPGATFAFGPDGLVVATPDGAPTPEGTVVYLGRPALVPPGRPVTETAALSPAPVESTTDAPTLLPTTDDPGAAEAPSDPPAAESPAAGPAAPAGEAAPDAAVGTEPAAAAETPPLALPGVPATPARPRPQALVETAAALAATAEAAAAAAAAAAEAAAALSEETTAALPEESVAPEAPVPADAPAAEAPPAETATNPEPPAEDTGPVALPGVPATPARPRPQDLVDAAATTAPLADPAADPAAPALAPVAPATTDTAVEAPPFALPGVPSTPAPSRPATLVAPEDQAALPAPQPEVAALALDAEVDPASPAPGTAEAGRAAATQTSPAADPALAGLLPRPRAGDAEAPAAPVDLAAAALAALGPPVVADPAHAGATPRPRPETMVAATAVSPATPAIAPETAGAAPAVAVLGPPIVADPAHVGAVPRPRPASLETAAVVVPATVPAAPPMSFEGATDLAIAAAPAARARPGDFTRRAAVAAAARSAAAATRQTAAAVRTPQPDAEAEADGEETATPAAVAAAPASNPKIPTRASVAKQATTSNAIRLNRTNLIGIYGSKSNRRALVRLSSGRYVKVTVGDRLDGGRVAAISDRELRLVKNGRNLVLKVGEGS